MTRREMLFMQVMEECDELSQRVSKAARFGLDEHQPNQPLSNRERISDEFNDLLALMRMAGLPTTVDSHKIEEKRRKVEKYLDYSKQCGTLTE
jgi:NTP pyrophosphatase (non-canonical NTP hydrolase)